MISKENSLFLGLLAMVSLISLVVAAGDFPETSSISRTSNDAECSNSNCIFGGDIPGIGIPGVPGFDGSVPPGSAEVVQKRNDVGDVKYVKSPRHEDANAGCKQENCFFGSGGMPGGGGGFPGGGGGGMPGGGGGFPGAPGAGGMPGGGGSGFPGGGGGAPGGGGGGPGVGYMPGGGGGSGRGGCGSASGGHGGGESGGGGYGRGPRM